MKKLVLLILLLNLGFLLACGTGGASISTPPIVSVSPSTITVLAGATQKFTATVTGTTNTAVTWSISGTGCTGTACGTIDATGLYTAPATVPAGLTITVTATLQSDPTKSGGGRATVPVITVTVAPGSPNVILGATQKFTATVAASNTAVTWSVTGPGTITSAGVYSAPATLTTSASATITATSQADTTKTASATVTIPTVTVAISPLTPSVMLGATQQFSATVGNATNAAVTWSVSGPGFLDNTGLYAAPAHATTPATATVRATSVADPTKSAVATITIPAVTVSVTPNPSTVILGATQRFSASVGNAVDASVTWSVSGPGLVDNTGLYATPSMLITPSTATLIATSVADPTKSGSATIDIPAVAISVKPPTVSLVGGATQKFTVTIANAVSQAATWTVSGGGLVDNTGFYAAPAVVPSQSTATVTATAVADSSKSGSAIVTLIPISVTLSPATVSVPLRSTQLFKATVDGTSNQNLTWSVSGTGCSGNDCGTISSSGLYTAPDKIPVPPTVTVKAVSAADITKSGSATVTITDNANAKLSGSYTFLFQGFGAGGNMTSTVGSFTADANGHLINGLMDSNAIGSSPSTARSFTGTYELHGDNRGIITFTSLSGSPSFRYGISDDATRGYMVEIDSTGTFGGGKLLKQTPADFLASKLAGEFAFGFSGVNPSNERSVIVGRMHNDGVGTLSSGYLDTNSPTSTAFTGTLAFSTATGSANGRGTMNISVPLQGTFPAAFYAVNADRFFFLMVNQTGIDQPLIMGEGRRQSGGPYTLNSLNGHCVFYSNGLSTSPNTSLVYIGQFAGASSSISGDFARMDGGTPTPQLTFLAAPVSTEANGRFVLMSPTLGNMILYLTANNTAFLMMSTGSGLGMIEPQTLPSGGLKLSDLEGNYFTNGTELPLADGGAFAGTLTLDDNGNWTGTADMSALNSGTINLVQTGQVVVTSSTPGRITNTVTSPLTFYHVLYAVSPDKLLILDIDPSYNNQGVLWEVAGYWEK